METNIRLLTKDDIEVKVKQITAKGALGLLYKTARVDRQILDDTFGALNWQNKFDVINGNLYCSIGVYNPDIKDFVWKSDCGVESQTEAEKGEASDAFKRAGFKWGIGVELYNSPFIWLNVPTAKDDNGKWQLADRFQRFEVKEIGIEADRTISKLIIVDSKTGESVFSFGSKSATAKPIIVVNGAFKEAQAIGEKLNPKDLQTANDWFFKTYGKTPITCADEKALEVLKKVYARALEKENAISAQEPSERAQTIERHEYVVGSDGK